jgi:hypothetical protein
MALLQNIMVAAGVGAAQLHVLLDRAEHFCGGPVSGRVQVRGGEIAQIAEVIEVRVQEDWTETRYRNGKSHTQHRTRVHGRAAVAVNFSVPAGGAFEWAFALSVPHGAPLHHTWTVQSTMRVPGAVDRHGSATLRLFASGAVMALKDALLQVAPFEVSSTGTDHFDLRPPAHLQHTLDGVKFLIAPAQMGGFLLGQIEINPQEKTLKDRMRAAVGADRVRHQLQVPLAQLVPGQPAPPELIAHLRGLLQPYLI